MFYAGSSFTGRSARELSSGSGVVGEREELRSSGATTGVLNFWYRDLKTGKFGLFPKRFNMVPIWFERGEYLLRFDMRIAGIYEFRNIEPRFTARLETQPTQKKRFSYYFICLPRGRRFRNFKGALRRV